MKISVKNTQGQDQGELEVKFALIENGKGNVDLYDTATVQSLANFTLPSLIGQAAFSTDGNSLNILTVDQSVYNVKVPGATQNAAVH